MGAVILPLMALYLGLLIWATWYGGRWVAKRGWQGKKRWLGAAIGFLIVYLPVFWDWIPTVVAHKYYCETEGGFWVYETPTDWKKSNSDLTSNDLKPLGSNEETLWDFPYRPLNNGSKNVLMINKRIYLDSINEKNFIRILPIQKRTTFIADGYSQKKLAEAVTFSSGYSNPMTIGSLQGFKGWLNNPSCGLKGKDGEDVIIFIKKIIELGMNK